MRSYSCDRVYTRRRSCNHHFNSILWVHRMDVLMQKKLCMSGCKFYKVPHSTGNSMWNTWKQGTLRGCRDRALWILKMEASEKGELDSPLVHTLCAFNSCSGKITVFEFWRDWEASPWTELAKNIEPALLFEGVKLVCNSGFKECQLLFRIEHPNLVTSTKKCAFFTALVVFYLNPLLRHIHRRFCIYWLLFIHFYHNPWLSWILWTMCV